MKNKLNRILNYTKSVKNIMYNITKKEKIKIKKHIHHDKNGGRRHTYKK